MQRMKLIGPGRSRITVVLCIHRDSLCSGKDNTAYHYQYHPSKTCGKRKEHEISTRADLIRAVLEIWAALPPAYIQPLYRSIPTPIRQVYRANGCITRDIFRYVLICFIVSYFAFKLSFGTLMEASKAVRYFMFKLLNLDSVVGTNHYTD